MLIIENNVKVRHGRKWKERWVVLKKLSPVANAPSLILYKDSSKSDAKLTILLDHYYGLLEGGDAVDGEEHLLSIVSPKPLLLAFNSEGVLDNWKSKITSCLGTCSHFQVAFADDGFPLRMRSNSRRHMSPSAKKQYHMFITPHHVSITTACPPLDHLFSWPYLDIKEIVYESSSKVRFAIDHKKTGFYCVSLNTKQAKELHLELLKNSDNFWKTRRSPKHLNFPIQGASLTSMTSDFMFSDPLHRQLVRPNLRKLSTPLKSRFMKARNSSFQGSEQDSCDGLMRHHSDYNLQANYPLGKLSLLKNVHHSSDEIQDNENLVPDNVTRIKNNGVNREFRSSTHSPHISRDTAKVQLPPKRYSLNKLKSNRSDTFSLHSNSIREKMNYEEQMGDSLLEDPSGEMVESTNSQTSNCLPSGQVFDPHQPLPYTDLSRYDGDSSNEPYIWLNENSNRLKNAHMSLSENFHLPFKEDCQLNGRNKHFGDYLQPMPSKGKLIKMNDGTFKEAIATLDELVADNPDQVDSNIQPSSIPSKLNENYISMQQINLNYLLPSEKTTNDSAGNGSASFTDSDVFCNNGSSVEDSVFLLNEPFETQDKRVVDDGYTMVNKSTNNDLQSSFKGIKLSNPPNHTLSDSLSSTPPTSSNFSSVLPPQSQDYINMSSPPPLPPKSTIASQKPLHCRSGSSDQGRVKRDVESHSKPPLPKRFNYPFNNSTQPSSFPFPTPVNKTPNRPFSAKSHSLKHRKPDLTIDTGVHNEKEAGLGNTSQRRPNEGRLSSGMFPGFKVKDAFDSISLRSTPQDVHQSSPSLATSKPRTGPEYINRRYLNDSAVQNSPSNSSMFTFDEKPPSSGGYDENSPHTPLTTSSLKSPPLCRPDLLSKHHPPSINPRGQQFFFPNADPSDSDKKLNYADIDMIDTSINICNPVLTDQTVYATINFLATKAVSSVGKLHARQREGSLDKHIEASSLKQPLSDSRIFEKRRLSLENKRVASKE